MKLLPFLCLFLFVGSSVGFIPGVLRQVADWSSITHRLITRAGLWSTVVEFFEDHPEYANEEQLSDSLVKSLDKGLLKGQIPHQLSGLIKSTKFEDAVKEIEYSNVEVDSMQPKFTSAHFDAEQFINSSRRLIASKKQIVALIKNAGDNEGNYATARKETGRLLHTLQDFYSHSNWIEFGNKEPLSILGDQLIDKKDVAGKNQKTCKSCTAATIKKFRFQKDDCEDNLILSTRKLTSGYFGGQDVVKPEDSGKCSHGGVFDSSKDVEATGGINKDSNLRDLSPHYRLHKTAAAVAIKATKMFFDGIRNTVGDKKFAKYLNMEALRTLSFAIDTTGSMSEEIGGVQKATIQFIEDAAADDQQSFYYVLVPFSDPGYGPVYTTSDPEVAKQKVEELKADGGGDCPEMGMHGLYLALVHSLPNSEVYYFTDADAKDEALALSVISLVLEKKCRINPFVSGGCSSKRRKRRDLSKKTLYETLARSTGGQYLEYSKATIDNVIKLLRRPNVSEANSSSLFREVTLVSVQVDTNATTTGKTYNIRSDSTIVSITAVLNDEGAANIQVISPTGNNESTNVIIQTKTVYAVRVTTPAVGLWTFKISAQGKYTLQVTALTTLTFSTSLEEDQGGIFVPIPGNPIKGQTLFVTVVPQPDELHTERNLTGYLIDLAGNRLQSFDLERGRELYSNSFYGSVILKHGAFKIMYEGYNTNNEVIQRLRPGVIKPQKFDIKVKLYSENSSLVLSPNETKSFNVTLRNFGPRQHFKIMVSDDKSFVRSYWPDSITLNRNESIDIKIDLFAPDNTSDSTTSSVSVSASVQFLSGSKYDVANFLSFDVSVFSKEFLFINDTEVTTNVSLTNFLIPPEKKDSDNKFPTYGIVLIVVGVVVILTLILTTMVLVNHRKNRDGVGPTNTEKRTNTGYA